MRLLESTWRCRGDGDGEEVRECEEYVGWRKRADEEQTDGEEKDREEEQEEQEESSTISPGNRCTIWSHTLHVIILLWPRCDSAALHMAVWTPWACSERRLLASRPPA